jgi:sugar lactone lactonase YvrE
MELYQRGVAAAQAEDWGAYLAAMDSASALAPAQPALLRHRAQALAQLKRPEEAIALLAQFLDLRVVSDLESYADLASLQTHPKWPELLAKAAANREPSGSMQHAFEIAVDDLIPEGIAYDATSDRFYVSSVAQRTIVRVDRSGRAEPLFAAGEHGYLSGLGLAIDAQRRRLWAVSDAPLDAGLFTQELAGRSAVHVFDLESGALVHRHEFPASDGHSLNDIAILPGGDAVASGAASGAILHLPADGGPAQVLLPAGSLPGANGLCIGGDGKTLYVSQYTIGIRRVELSTLAVSPATSRTNFTTCGVDGLYWYEDSLVAVQNYMGLDRVVRFRFEQGEIGCVEVLVGRQPIFVDPTTGCVIGDEFFFIANSKVEPFLRRPDPAARGGFGRASICRVKL